MTAKRMTALPVEAAPGDKVQELLVAGEHKRVLSAVRLDDAARALAGTAPAGDCIYVVLRGMGKAGL